MPRWHPTCIRFTDCLAVDDERVESKDLRRILVKMRVTRDILSTSPVTFVAASASSAGGALRVSLGWMLITAYIILIAILTGGDHVPIFSNALSVSLVKINDFVRALLRI